MFPAANGVAVSFILWPDLAPSLGEVLVLDEAGKVLAEELDELPHDPGQLPQPVQWLANRDMTNTVDAPCPIEGCVVKGQLVHIALLK